MDASSIRALRARAGWTQAELAERLGTDPVTVSRWERGVSRPRRSARVRLQQLAGPLAPEIEHLIGLLDPGTTRRLLQRHLLLARLPRPVTFAATPAARLRATERARREQLALKARARIVS